MVNQCFPIFMVNCPLDYPCTISVDFLNHSKSEWKAVNTSTAYYKEIKW